MPFAFGDSDAQVAMLSLNSFLPHLTIGDVTYLCSGTSWQMLLLGDEPMNLNDVQ